MGNLCIYKELRGKVYLVDEIDEVAYDFTNYPYLEVKSKVGKLLNENIQVHQVSFGLLKY